MSERGFLDPETLREVLRQLEQTDVDELEVRAGDGRLYIRREPGMRSAISLPPDGSEVTPGAAIAAPLTGVYYARPMPDQPPYVQVGDWIEVGQIVALIETMKLFNEVIADVAGEIVEVSVGEGDLVEVGQPIMFVRGGDE